MLQFYDKNERSKQQEFSAKEKIMKTASSLKKIKKSVNDAAWKMKISF